MVKSFLNTDKASHITAFIIIFFAVFLLFQGLFKGEIIATNDISTNDLLYYTLPLKQLYAESLKSGEILQWSPMVYGGFPLFAEGQNQFLYPVNMLFCYLLNPFQAMNFLIIFHCLFMGFGFYLFARKITGSSWNSIPVGVAAAICGSLIAGHTRHMNVLSIITFAPWLLLVAESYIKKFKISTALLFGCILGMTLLLGHPPFAFVLGFTVSLYFLLRYFFIYKYEKPDLGNSTKAKYFGKRILLFFILAAVTTIAISYVQTRETILLSQYSQRGENLTSEFTGLGSLGWNGFLTFIYPYYMGNVGDGTFQSQSAFFFWEYFHYASLVIFILAIIGIYGRWKKNHIVKVLVIISVISYLFALGETFPVYKIFSIFPLIKTFRFPARWLLGTEISIIALGGFGIQVIIDKIFKKNNYSTRQLKKKTVKEKKLSKFQSVIHKYPYIPGIALSLLIIIDIYTVAGKQVVTTPKEIFFNNPDVFSKFRSSNNFNRIFTIGSEKFNSEAFEIGKGWESAKSKSLYSLGTKLLPPNMAAFYHIPMIGGYLNLTPKYMYEVWGDQNNQGIISRTGSIKDNNKTLSFQPSFIKIAKMWSVKYFTSIWKLEEPFKLTWDSAGLYYYELPDVLPRSWIVKNLLSVPKDDYKITAETLIDNNFDPKVSAVVSGSLPKLPDNADSGSAQVMDVKNHSMKIKASVPGLLVINDSWYPRWKARVDGNESEVYRVNGMMRGIVIPKENSDVELYYDEGNVLMFFVIGIAIFIIVSVYSFIDIKGLLRRR